MKKLLSFFMLFTLFFSVGRAEAVMYSMTPDTASTGLTNTAYITSMTEFTINGVSWKMNQWNPTTLQVKTNQSSAASEFRFYNTSAFPGRIAKVVITFKTLNVTDATKLMFLGGESEVTATTGGTAGTWDADSLTLTWEPASTTDYTFFAFYQNGKAASGTNYLAEADAIVVTYETEYTPAKKLYLTGTFNNWNTTADEMTLGADGKYTITMALAAEARVKFIDDSENWYGAPAAANTYYWLTQDQVGETITIGVGNGYEDIYFPVAGEWTFSVDLENEEVIITGQWPGTYETVTIPYTESLVSNIGKFVVENVEMGGLETIWQSNSYGLTGNGHNCTSHVESWCLSPLIDASSVGGVTLTFDENARYFAEENFATEATLWVREGANGEWAAVTIPNHVIATSNSFANVGNIDLSAYAGKVFQLGFKYVADTAAQGRWEIKNLKVTEAAAQTPQVATVAGIKTSTGTFEFTGTSLVATAQKGSYLYAQDATGGILIYGSVGQTYKLGEIIPAGFTGEKSEFHGAPQVGSPAGFTAATDSVEVTPKEFAVADFNLDNFGIYGVVRGATVNGNTITFADNTFATYTTFESVPTDASGKTYDVYGIMGWRDGVQFLPIEYVAMTTTNHAAPTITLKPEKDIYFVGDEVTVIFSSEETGLNIGYDITDAETFPENYCVPITNGDSITVTANEPKTVTVRAYAYGYEENDPLGNSEVVTKEIVFNEIPVPGDKYELVTDSTQIAADNEYVLVYTKGDVVKAMGGPAQTTGAPFRSAVDAGVTEFTLEDGVVTLMSTTTVTPFVLVTAKENRFYIKIDGKNYLYWSAGNSVESGNDGDEMLLTLDADGNIQIQDYSAWEARYLQYNESSPRYAFYKGTQKNAKLYVKMEAPAGMPGDANNDGKVDVNDVTTVINYILGKNPDPFNFDNANINGDDAVDVMDVTLIIDIILHPNS